MLGAILLLAVAGSAIATPSVNSVVIVPRVYNDCPISILSTTNNYPAQVVTDDTNQGCVGYANLHVWRFSTDGSSAAIFSNGDAFRFCADLVISGSGQCESGLQVRPWWSESDGRLNVRTTDGEIACFGGRLPFYSFTGSHGITYVKGLPIRLEIIYLPNGLSQASPATIEYKVTYNAVNYSSGQLPFDQGNPAEDPPYGLWGILNQAQVGAHHQMFMGGSGPFGQTVCTWSNICYEALVVAVEDETWGTIKSLYR
jgi:hypothetical protein